MHTNFCHTSLSWPVVFCGGTWGMANFVDQLVLEGFVSIFGGGQLSVEALEMNSFPGNKIRTGLLWSRLLRTQHFLGSADSVWQEIPTQLNLFVLFLFLFMKTEVIRNSILTCHLNIELTNIVDLSPESVSVFIMAFWFAVCQHYTGDWLIFSALWMIERKEWARFCSHWQTMKFVVIWRSVSQSKSGLRH